MKLVRTGAWCRVEDPPDREAVYKLLAKPFSYKVEGAEFSESYRMGQWDGRMRLVKRERGGPILVPSGLWEEALRILGKAGYTWELEDQRLDPVAIETGPWAGYVLRPYQQEAVDKAVAAGGGVLRLPIRAGKTLVAAAIVHEIQQRALFVVPSDLLLGQTAKAFRQAMPELHVTEIGGGEWNEEGQVVVATVQSLLAHLRERKFMALARGCSVVFSDECHHLGGQGEEWRNVVLALQARHKWGLSGTVSEGKARGDQGAELWLRALCGPVVYSLGTSDLIEMGYLVRPTIRFLRYEAPLLKGKLTAQQVYSLGITQCEPRNALVVREAVQYARAGRGVLVDAARIGHSRELAHRISQELLPGQCALLLGTTPAEERQGVLQAFRAGRVRVIVGTILGEGVDVPEIEVVINAEGGQAKASTIQRLRNLTWYEGKQAEVVELADVHHKTLRGWTLERLGIYKAERAFKIVVGR